MIFLGALFLFQTTMISSRFLNWLGTTIAEHSSDTPQRMTLRSTIHRQIENAQEAIDASARRPDATPDDVNAEREKQLRKLRDDLFMWDREYTREVDGHREPTERGLEHRDRILKLFRERGAEAFQRDEFRMWVDGNTWPTSSGEETRFLAACGSFLFLLLVAVLAMSLGMGNKDLGRVEWGMEWMFTFPVSTRSLAAARIMEFTLVNPLGWFMVFPFLLMFFVAGGFGWWALPLGLVVALFLNILVAVARCLIETWVRLKFTVARAKNAQAVFTLLGFLTLMAALYPAVAPELPEWVGDLLASVPTAATWLPSALPLHLALPDLDLGVRLGGLLLLAAASVGLVAFGAWATSRLLRTGLMAAGGSYQGARVPGRSGDSRTVFGGALGKDLRLLWRDRSFMVRTLFMPALIVLVQLAINPRFLEGAAESTQHAAMLAFGIGAYVLLFGGFSVMSAEGHTLWLLYTFPTGLADVFRRKTRLWASVSAIYVIGTLLLLILLRGHLEFDVAWRGALALAGILVYAHIAVGISVLGFDPDADEQRATRPSMTYLYMLLVSIYGYALYAARMWESIQLLIICAVLAYAIWQKVRENFPFILDPTATPPRRVTLADGLVAAAMFFVLQALFTAAYGAGEVGSITLGFATAGLTVVVLVGIVLSLRGIDGVGARLAVGRATGRSSGWAKAALIGVVGGAAAAVVGVVYLMALQNLPQLQWVLDAAPRAFSRGSDDFMWLAFLAVVFAPLFEEFIFRGMIYRGFRHTLSAPVSIVASAALFAIVHPAVSTLPVFALGLAAAFVFERTKLLIAPILAHMVYNAAVVAAQS